MTERLATDSTQCRRFTDKVAVVTGAAQGIGRATALRLAAEDAIVVVADRVQKQADQVAAEINASGGTARVILADLETWDGADYLMRETHTAFGRIDIAVHNVGGTIWAKPFWQYPIDQIEKEISRSLWPTMWCCRAVIPYMIRQQSGAIVNVGSVATRGINRVPYSASKGGVVAMTVCLAMELAEHNIRVNCVSPGGVDAGKRAIPRSNQPPDPEDLEGIKGVMEQTMRDTPMGRFGRPEELAATIAYMASDDASYVTGQTLDAAGGGISIK